MLNKNTLEVIKMANPNRQRKLTLAPTKSTILLKWIVEELDWKKISESLDKSRTSAFRIKKQIADLHETEKAFDVLAQVFTIAELNTLIDLYNHYLENPEEFSTNTRKTSAETREEELQKQKEKAEAEMRRMGIKSKVDITTELSEDSGKEEPKQDKGAKKPNKSNKKEQTTDGKQTATSQKQTKSKEKKEKSVNSEKDESKKPEESKEQATKKDRRVVKTKEQEQKEKEAQKVRENHQKIMNKWENKFGKKG